jgi:hypothetical protein
MLIALSNCVGKKLKGESHMKNTSRIFLSVISSSILAAGAWALPARIANVALSQSAAPAAAQLQSASGKIASVETSSFTLETGSAMTKGQQLQQAPQSKTMTFQIDKNTSVTGKLVVGSSADVTYRVDGTNNIAVNVAVTP